jgi:hypothetical protein
LQRRSPTPRGAPSDGSYGFQPLDEEAATDDARTQIATGGQFSSGINTAAIRRPWPRGSSREIRFRMMPCSFHLQHRAIG